MGSALEAAMTAILSGDKSCLAAKALTKQQVVVMGKQSALFRDQTLLATKAVILQKSFVAALKRPSTSGAPCISTSIRPSSVSQHPINICAVALAGVPPS